MSSGNESDKDMFEDLEETRSKASTPFQEGQNFFNDSEDNGKLPATNDDIMALLKEIQEKQNELEKKIMKIGDFLYTFNAVIKAIERSFNQLCHLIFDHNFGTKEEKQK